ncbi:signal recognition particle protein [Chloroflexus sp. MS-CIW-1]|jgi:signal recognition particle subunit SRP54|uniref:signal recognition particle protein n=1 Tax=unclassified Chloroflexus TaxID=2633855 RepID=UPI0004DF489A|nr:MULTISPECIES: signal recognition particle protein [unclassified Chloroflexus]MBO9311070.1 signal recognition particle protein [Chloroflexus sp.]MBO9337152.1 signal recognition particle protein [Chloroflexus sp.]MBO9348172.1 signal recognition particle protein [Chloroflexus sp.]MDN5271550.1 signal recognition particle protein [Chloroflexus sp. MS-CIW-1]
MFESLSDRLQAVFQKLGSKGILTEDDVREAMKQVRLALLEADVNLRVVKDFVTKVTEKAIGEEVTKSLTPHQQVIKIVHQELINLLGTEHVPLQEARPGPTVIMLVGLQGTGKTTLAAKLALHLRKKGKRVLLVAADVYRPAAITQLQALGRQLNIPVYSEGTQASPPDIAEHAVEHARKELFNVVIIDTAGRLQIDEPLMQELEQIESRVHPIERLLVVDAMTGQEAVRVAETFNQRVKLTGVVMTKMDGDARGGAALSVRAVTGVPIKFLSTGEKVDGNTLEVFHPDRLASRILGMGDVLSLIERAEQLYDAEQAKKMQKRLSKGEFDFEDFLTSLHQMRKLGPLQQIIAMIPGLNQLARNEELLDERHIKRVEAIIYSMTPEERRRPEIIKGSRRERIARGSGTSVQEVSQLVKQFQQMQRMMKQLAGKGGKGRGGIDPNELLRRLR